jgi:hypothetical protein
MIERGMRAGVGRARRTRPRVMVMRVAVDYAGTEEGGGDRRK